MNEKHLTIITVCFNSEKTIERTLKNVSFIKNKNIEYIVVDGESTDSTLKIIDRYQEYIDQLISEKDDGIYSAMNKGIRLSTGKYVSFLNSDDYYNVESFFDVYKLLKDENYDYIYGNIEVDYGEIKKTKRPRINKKLNSVKNVFENIMNHPASFIKQEVLVEEGLFDERFQISGDKDLLYRIESNDKYKGMYIDKEITVFKHGGISFQKKTINEKLFLKKKHNQSWFVFLNSNIYRYSKQFVRNILMKYGIYIFKIKK